MAYMFFEGLGSQSTAFSIPGPQQIRPFISLYYRSTRIACFKWLSSLRNLIWEGADSSEMRGKIV
jgi:hypothetical protein